MTCSIANATVTVDPGPQDSGSQNIYAHMIRCPNRALVCCFTYSRTPATHDQAAGTIVSEHRCATVPECRAYLEDREAFYGDSPTARLPKIDVLIYAVHSSTPQTACQSRKADGSTDGRCAHAGNGKPRSSRITWCQPPIDPVLRRRKHR
jgi:hypothetical protein